MIRGRAVGIESNVTGHLPVGELSEPSTGKKVCVFCGREGSRGFMYADAGTVCANVEACTKRAGMNVDGTELHS